MNKKKIVVFILVGGIIAVSSFAFSSKAYAQGNMNNNNLIQRIITKFNLNESEVNKVVEEFRTERQSEMKMQMQERLSEAVANGNLTNEQKDKILAKLEEIHTKRDVNQNLTFEERRDLMVQHREEMENWAKENNIDLKYVMGFGRMSGMGFRRNRE